jgi:hypothetical protein
MRVKRRNAFVVEKKEEVDETNLFLERLTGSTVLESARKSPVFRRQFIGPSHTYHTQELATVASQCYGVYSHWPEICQWAPTKLCQRRRFIQTVGTTHPQNSLYYTERLHFNMHPFLHKYAHDHAHVCLHTHITTNTCAYIHT